MPSIHVHFLPQLVDPAELAGGVSLVIDVLRATTTITTALAAGAREVIACLEVEDARRVAANLPAGEAVLGGERHGLPIKGFSLGNSPRDYTAASVGGRSVVFTTTNGTRAMLHAAAAEEVWLAAFVNLAAIVQAANARERIDLLCSGTDGKITREDVLLAGAIAAHWSNSAAAELNDQAAVAVAAWQQAVSGAGSDRTRLIALLGRTLRATQGGRNLRRLGLEGDIDDAAAVNRFAIVPRLDRATGKIRSLS